MANENQYYKYPFAENGNADEVPDQASGGNVDYESGYGPDYEKAVGVADRKRIERTSFNGILKGVTKNIKQSQEHNWPTWIEDDGSSEPATPFSYDAGVVVYHNGQAWVSLVGSNQDEPSEISGKWVKYKPENILFDEGRLLEQDGYLILSNGMIRQWGRVEMNPGVDVTTQLPIEFPNGVLSFQVTSDYTRGSGVINVITGPVANVNLNSITIRFTGSTTTFSYEVLGY